MFRIYVGNLPYSVRDAELQTFFADGGCKVKMAVVPLTHDNRSKGFGFVEFEDEESFTKALAMNNKEMGGRPLRIDQARPREERDGGGDAPRPAASDATEAPAPKANKADDKEEEVVEEAPAAAKDDVADTDADTE